MIDRALAGFLLAGALALGARAVRSLSRGGAVAALLVGTAAAMAGWPWAFVLITFFLTSSGLSRFRRTAREALIAGIVEKSDERDAIQVLANGGLFAAMALASTLTGQPLLATAALGALAAAAADTWATEVGTLAGGVPRSVVSLEPLAPGTSGGVTVAGTIASVAGAALVAVVAWLTGAASMPVAVFVGGIVGSAADSLVGATVQERRWCDHCAKATERRLHTCGTATRITGGIAGVRNDFVNVVCTVAGAAVAALVAR